MAAFSVIEAMVGWVASMGYRASTRVPKDPPDVFVTVERTNDDAAGMHGAASVAIRVWAPTDAEAEEAANALRLAMLCGSPPRGVHSVRSQGGRLLYYDEATRRATDQFVLSVAYQLETKTS